MGPFISNYVFGRTLGRGSFSQVKLAQKSDTGEFVAVKIVAKHILKKQSLMNKLRSEISVLKLLSHENLTSLLDVIENSTHIFLVMEFSDGPDFFDYLVGRGALPLSEALSFFQQIICGVEYCHKRLICHRDIKPENILLDKNMNVKIADFGLATLSQPGEMLDSTCGSPHYCDPVIARGAPYDGRKADIWSCGVVLFAMVTGHLPFNDDNLGRLLKRVQTGNYELPSNLPDDLRSLIKAMMNVHPDQRISIEQIKKHPWYNSSPPPQHADDFSTCIPTAPIPVPDRTILKILIDLQWGDEASIVDDLRRPGEHILKALYAQLQRHSMSHRPRPEGTPGPPPVVPSPRSTGPPPVSPAPCSHPPASNLSAMRMTCSPTVPANVNDGGIKQKTKFVRQNTKKAAGGVPANCANSLGKHPTGQEKQPLWFAAVWNYLRGRGPKPTKHPAATGGSNARPMPSSSAAPGGSKEKPGFFQKLMNVIFKLFGLQVNNF